MVEIAKALEANAKILIMDEPTSALTSVEITQLFSLIRGLKQQGVGIIYISHRLDELQYIVDAVTIMRDGRFIVEQQFSDITMSQIIGHMVGHEIKEKYPRVQVEKGKAVLTVTGLSAAPNVHDVSLTVHEGEILGIAGLMGAGRTETTRQSSVQSQAERDHRNPWPRGQDQTTPGCHQGRSGPCSERSQEGWALHQALGVGEHRAAELDNRVNSFGVVNRKKERRWWTRSSRTCRCVWRVPR